MKKNAQPYNPLTSYLVAFPLGQVCHLLPELHEWCALHEAHHHQTLTHKARDAARGKGRGYDRTRDGVNMLSSSDSTMTVRQDAVGKVDVQMHRGVHLHESSA